MPGGNFPISTRLVEEIIKYEKSGQVYLRAYPHWYDGNALRTQLTLAGVTWGNELTETSIDWPSLVDGDDPMIVLFHPADNETRAALNEAYPQAIVLSLNDNHGSPAYMILFNRPPHP